MGQGVVRDMHHTLAMTGTTALLEQLSPFVPDDFINELVPPHSGRGRRPHWSSARLYRLLLLTVLTPALVWQGEGEDSAVCSRNTVRMPIVSPW